MGSKDAASRPLIFRVRMNDGAAARTDGKNMWVDDRLNDVEMRCAVEHETVHIELGHSTCQPEYVEMAVRYETARRLLPDMSAGCAGESLAVSARHLGVTRRVLMDRSATLSDVEMSEAGCESCQLCPAMKYRFQPA